MTPLNLRTLKISLLLSALASWPCWAEAVLNEALAAFNEGRRDDAEHLFTAQLNQPAQANAARVYLSKIALQKGEVETAVKQAEQALKQAPNDAEELITAADAYCALAQQSSLITALKMAHTCIDQYDAAVELEPDNTRALIAAIRFHMDAPSIAGGSSKRGQALLKRLTQLAPEDAHIIALHLLDKAGKNKEALSLADQLSQKGFTAAENQYAVALYYKDHKQIAQSKTLFNALLSWHVTPNNRWQIQDSYFQLGELILEEAIEPKMGIQLIETYKKLNDNPGDVHYFWSSWRLAKGYKSLGQSAKYDEWVRIIQAAPYKKNAAFAKEFNARSMD